MEFLKRQYKRAHKRKDTHRYREQIGGHQKGKGLGVDRMSEEVICMVMDGNDIIVIISHWIQVSNHYVVHLKIKQCYVSIIP